MKINEQFQISRQLWAHLVEQGDLQSPEEFIRPLPHISFVYGKDHVEFLTKRVEALKDHPQFQGMEFSIDPERIKEWIPLMMEGRSTEEPIAATKVDHGTDVNFGELTRQMLKHLEQQDNIEIRYNHSVDDIQQREDGAWEVKVRNLRKNHRRTYSILRLYRCRGRRPAIAAKNRHSRKQAHRRISDQRRIPRLRQPGGREKAPFQSLWKRTGRHAADDGPASGPSPY